MIALAGSLCGESAQQRSGALDDVGGEGGADRRVIEYGFKEGLKQFEIFRGVADNQLTRGWAIAHRRPFREWNACLLKDLFGRLRPAGVFMHQGMHDLWIHIHAPGNLSIWVRTGHFLGLGSFRDRLLFSRHLRHNIAFQKSGPECSGVFATGGLVQGDELDPAFGNADACDGPGAVKISDRHVEGLLRGGITKVIAAKGGSGGMQFMGEGDFHRAAVSADDGLDFEEWADQPRFEAKFGQLYT